MDQAAYFESYRGRSRSVQDQIAVSHIQRLAATLDENPSSFAAGGELPQGWHAVLFGSVAPQQSLGQDGLPADTDFLPSLPGMRRMFAGRRTVFHSTLRIGDTVERVSSVADVQ